MVPNLILRCHYYRFSELKLLTEISVDAKTKICTKLNSKKDGGAKTIRDWKHLAEKYSVDHDSRSAWEKGSDAAESLIDYLETKEPHLTVYDFIKNVVAIERNDVVMVLNPELTKKASADMM